MSLSETTARRSGRKLVPYPGLKERGIPWTRMHLGRLEAEGKFPQRIHLGANTVCWFEDEVDAFLEERAAARQRRNAGAKPEIAETA
jgi:prophage regulatory protein